MAIPRLETSRSPHPLGQRVLFEAFGPQDPNLAHMRHNPSWALSTMNDLRQQNGGPIENMLITPTDWKAMVDRLQPNEGYADLAQIWATQQTCSHINFYERPTIIYGSSGSTMNDKEGEQVRSVARKVTKLRKEKNPEALPTVAVEFIDTASHEMAGELAGESEMYAAIANQPTAEVSQRYTTLFAKNVNRTYIQKTLATFTKYGASPALLEQLTNNWNQRCEGLHVPADAINLPDLDEYVQFYESIGFDDHITQALRSSYQQIADNQLPPTVGTLRCVFMTRLSEMMAEKMGDQTPFFAVPHWAISQRTGFSTLTLQEISQLVHQVSGFNPDEPQMFFNVMDLYGDGELGITTEKNQFANNDHSLNTEYRQIIMQLTHEEACRIGHNSGELYYRQLELEGLLGYSGLMVADNYEAGRVFERYTENRSWLRDTTFMMGLVRRGWISDETYHPEKNPEDITYGNSIRTDMVAHTFFSSPAMPKTLDTFIDLVAENAGTNSTVALTTGKNPEIVVVWQNELFAKANEKRASYPTVSITEDQLRWLFSITTPEAFATTEEEQIINRYRSLERDIKAQERLIEDTMRIYPTSHPKEYAAYWQARIEAIAIVAASYGVKALPAVDETQSLDRVTDHLYDATLTAIINKRHASAEKEHPAPETAAALSSLEETSDIITDYNQSVKILEAAASLKKLFKDLDKNGPLIEQALASIANSEQQSVEPVTDKRLANLISTVNLIVQEGKNQEGQQDNQIDLINLQTLLQRLEPQAQVEKARTKKILQENHSIGVKVEDKETLHPKELGQFADQVDRDKKAICQLDSSTTTIKAGLEVYYKQQKMRKVSSIIPPNTAIITSADWQKWTQEFMDIILRKIESKASGLQRYQALEKYLTNGLIQEEYKDAVLTHWKEIIKNTPVEDDAEGTSSLTDFAAAWKTLQTGKKEKVGLKQHDETVASRLKDQYDAAMNLCTQRYWLYATSVLRLVVNEENTGK